jgi:hypothetical protein
MNHKQKADQGWHQMRTLLDREMPQKHRRRAAGWWWMALLWPLLPMRPPMEALAPWTQLVSPRGP